ncbi:AAA family ATPase [Accumulibacter sp.]|uniref:AAA family ATPase n=1 Tax=Accumulibacter sp. TaxID=2053492 RepID=UPI0035B21FE8
MQFTRKHFDPASKGEPLAGDRVSCRFADARGRLSLYVYDPRLTLAINVALAAKRPLLLAGEPGCGKTSLARNVAKVLGWWYYQQTVSSRTQASDLLWEYDALRRLNDAYVRNRNVLPDHCYVEPGPLWWALAPDTAALRGWARMPLKHRLGDPGEAGEHNHALILLDEIDKAEPDVPNDLLEILDTRSFSVKNVPIRATREKTLVVLTTNGERELPGAFLRRCVTYRFPEADAAWFEEVAMRWLPEGNPQHHHDVAERLIAARDRARAAGQRMPGTAEYLDALHAFADLGLTVDSAEWREVERCVFDKAMALDSAPGGR